MKSGNIFAAAAFLGFAALWPAVASADAVSDLNGQAQAAIAAGNWQAAADALNKLIAINKNWTSYQALGDVEYNLGDFQKAADAWDTAIAGAQDDTRMARDKLSAAIGTMQMSKGHALEQLNKNDDAIRSYQDAIRYLDNPAPSYFAVCALEFNTGPDKGADALAQCNKAIAADPTMANAYFVKGAILMRDVKSGPNKQMFVPPGTAESLQKYLQLAPTGDHAQDAKDMLTAIKS